MSLEAQEALDRLLRKAWDAYCTSPLLASVNYRQAARDYATVKAAIPLVDADALRQGRASAPTDAEEQQ